MIEPNKKDMEGLHLNFSLADRERAVLASAVKQEWFDILQRIMEEEIRLLNVKLINTDGADEKAIVSNHRIAKGAAMFYAGLIQRLQEELGIYAYTASGIGTPGNPEAASATEDFQ